MNPDWVVARHEGTAEQLHALVVPDDGVRRLWLLEPTGPAVVLGSTQRDDLVDHDACARDGIAVARRRSGGGAVWVAPGDPVWLDVLVPRDDPLWDDDVGRSFLPIGRAWQEALGETGVTGTRVHDGPLVRTEWSDLVCFAGAGPGEVFLGDAKVVGMSQRRTRAGARFQCAVHRHWRAEPLRSLLRPQPPAGALDASGAGIGDVPVDDLVTALAAALGHRVDGGVAIVSELANNRSMSTTSVTSVNRYAVKADRVEEFLQIIDQHCATLRDLELITDREVEVFVGDERDTGEPVVIEIFEWADEGATERAHTHPAVSEVWESMGPLCESRANRGPFEFLNLERRDR